MFRLTSQVLAALLSVSAASVVHAETAPDWLSVSGFGTLAANYHNSSGVLFRRDYGQRDGASAGQVSLVSDSMLGVQLTARPMTAWDATLQLVSRQTIDGNFRPEVSWGYLKYKFDETASLRVGRMNGDFYLRGDSAEIGYANLQVRQPIILYPRNFDGVDGEVTVSAGAGTLRMKAAAGITQGKLLNWGDPYDMGGSRVVGGLIEYAWRGWTTRLSAINLRLRHDSTGASYDALSAGLAAVPNGAAILERIAMHNRLLAFRSLAVGYDRDQWQASGSYSQLSTTGWGTRKELYGALGYHIDEFTPYLSASRQTSSRDFIQTGIPNGFSPATDALNLGASLVQTGMLVNQSGVALGLRYDFAPNRDVKLQVDRIRYQDPLSIYDPQLFTRPAETRGDKSMTVYSVALDFVF